MNYKFTLLLFLLALFSAKCLFSQKLSGVIYDEATNGVLSAAIVKNIASGVVVTSDVEGKYVINVKYGDTISVVLLGYRSVQFVVKDAGRADIFRNVYLIPEYNYMDEVTVTALTPYQRDSLARRELYGDVLARDREWVSGAAAVFSPATALAQLVSKKSKQRKKFQKNFYKWEDERYIESRYTPELVAQITKLSGDSLYYFINTYPIEGDFARAATQTELKMWIRYNFLDWQAKPANKRVAPNAVLKEK
jgi:hypothetical protein